jgi:hypothetical protein
MKTYILHFGICQLTINIFHVMLDFLLKFYAYTKVNRQLALHFNIWNSFVHYFTFELLRPTLKFFTEFSILLEVKHNYNTNPFPGQLLVYITSVLIVIYPSTFRRSVTLWTQRRLNIQQKKSNQLLEEANIVSLCSQKIEFRAKLIEVIAFCNFIEISWRFSIELLF